MAELSGPFASVGEDCRRGYEIAKAAFTDNGIVGNYKVNLVYGDHQRDAKLGVTEYNRLLNQARAIAIVSNASSVVMAINPMSAARGLPLIGSSAHPQFIKNNPYGFRFWLNADVEGGALAQKAIEMGKKSAAIITLEEDYPLAVSNGFVPVFEKLGGTIVANEHVLKTDVDYAGIIARLRAKPSDLVFVNVIGDQLPVLLKKLREQGIKQQIFSTFSMSKKEYLDVAGHENVEGIIYLEINGEKPKFTQKLFEVSGTRLATGLNYTCYAGLAFVLEALKQNPNVFTSADLFATLQKIDGINLLDGTLYMKEREAQLEYLFRIVRDGQLVDFKG
ncbi:MAG: ABC transporter substrate-binding protein [Deltaproteobacteria bacterium]|nr:ABC transporter substrate-binding protein [Deltaproteobacteria bacterium]